MIRKSWTRMASIEETLALWAASLREIKKRIRPLFRQERVAANAGLFLEGLLSDEQRKTGWMRAEAAGDPGPWGQQGILGRRAWCDAGWIFLDMSKLPLYLGTISPRYMERSFQDVKWGVYERQAAI